MQTLHSFFKGIEQELDEDPGVDHIDKNAGFVFPALLLILHHRFSKNAKTIHPKPVIAARIVLLGVTRLPAACFAEAVVEAAPVAEIDVVTVTVFGATVVPGIVVAGFVVADTTVVPLTTLAVIV